MERDATGPTFASEDDEAHYYLGLIRDGGADQKRAARDRLGRIFERRGLLDEAAACYETNLAEGVRDPRLTRRLADIYRRQGRPGRSAGGDPRAGRVGSAAAGGSLPLRLGLGAVGCALILVALAMFAVGRPASPPDSGPEAAPSAQVSIDPARPGPQDAALASSGAGRTVRESPGAGGDPDAAAAGAQPVPSATSPKTASPPETGRPTLADAAYGPCEARPGSTLTLTYDVHNPGTEVIEAVLGAAIRPRDGDWQTDPTEERVVRVPPGRSAHTRHLRVPADAPAGAYDVRIAILSADRGVTHAERTDLASLNVGMDQLAGTPDEPIRPGTASDPPPSPAPAPTATPAPPEPTRPPATATRIPPTQTTIAATPTPPLPAPTAPAQPPTSQPAVPRDQASPDSPSQPRSAPAAPAPAVSRSTPVATASTAAPSAASGAGRAGGRGARLDCPDFPSQAAAQAALREQPSDPHHLDADRDGIACENNRPPRDTRPVPR